MDAITPARQGQRGIWFGGSGMTFLGRQLVNVLLTIITLGIYRFWATVRNRRYLWANTEVDDQPLDYSGEGAELFVGALLALLIFVPLSFASSAIALVASGGDIATGQLISLAVLGPVIVYLMGVGLYRGLRYLLSRTAWRGIRGGMTGNGWGYGWLYLRLTLLQIATLGLATPYVSTRLWNAKWGDVMVGTLPMTADAPWRPLMKRFLLSFVPVLAIYAGMLAVLHGAGMLPGSGAAPPSPERVGAMVGTLLLTVYGGFALILLVMLNYYAFYYRHVVSHLRVDGLAFAFDARGRDWLRYYLINAALVVFTFGIGWLLLVYRKWKFVMRHLKLEGAVDEEALAQSRLDAPRQGEGIADALGLTPF